MIKRNQPEKQTKARKFILERDSSQGVIAMINTMADKGFELKAENNIKRYGKPYVRLDFELAETANDEENTGE